MVIAFIEELLFAPRSFAQKFLVWALSPLGKLAAFWQWKKLNAKKPVDLEIKVVSVGNLTIGGSGKTPLIVALAKRFDKAAIILRGYGRKNRELIVLDDRCAVRDVGDEALLYRSLLKSAIVIVSIDRKAGVLKAKELGAKVVFLDDGFRHREIKKFDILIRPLPEPLNNRVLPAGCYRLPLKAYQLADFVAKEGEDFARKCEISNPTDRMVLVTAISRAKRLDKFLPQNVVAKYAFRDHAVFDVETLKAIAKKHNAASLLVTRKDLVKLENFWAIALSVLELEIIVGDRLLTAIDDYCEKTSDL